MALSLAQLRSQLAKGEVGTVYLLYGEEPYFLDRALQELETHALGSADRSFNLDVAYGQELDAGKLVALARAYPVMAPRRMVVAKEAHRLRKDHWDALAAYVQAPSPHTCLVLVWPQKNPPDARTKLGKLLQTQAAVLESKPLYDNKVPAWMEEHLREQGFSIDADAAHLVAQHMGTQLQAIANELEKVLIHLRAAGTKTVTRDLVHEHVNIDRQFNVFELNQQLGLRNAPAAQNIMQHLAKTPKENPPVLLLAQLFAYYLRLAQCLQAGARTDADVARLLHLNPFIAKQYVPALHRHTLARAYRNLGLIYEADLQLKGILPTQMDDAFVLETLCMKLLMD